MIQKTKTTTFINSTCVRSCSRKLHSSRTHSLDEQIIVAKTSYSGIHQYNLKKPVKWGFQNFVWSGASGIMYDFFLYSDSVNGQKCTGSYVVLKLLETLPKYKNFKIFFDSLFSSIPLCLALKDYGYLATATLRADRTKDCPLPTEKYLKKQKEEVTVSEPMRTVASH